MSAPTWPEQRAEGYSSARALGRTILAVLSLALIGTLLGVVVFATAARAAGSDSPTPYTVDRTGITLPAGETFPDGAHVNVRWDGGAAGLHFEGKCVTRTDAECAGARHDAAQFIGASFIPWAAFGVPADACVVWVQISTYSEHFGEGGQSPVCLTEETPCPTESPSTTPTTPTEPTSTPTEEPSTSPSETPTETPSTTPTPEPSSSASTTPTTPPATPDPTTEPTAPEPPFDGTNGDPTTWPEDYNQGDDEVTYRSEVSAVDETNTPRAELAATGANGWGVGVTAAIALILGCYLVVFEVRRRRGERCPRCGGPLEAITRTHPVHGDWDGVTCRDCFWTEVR